MQSSSSLPSRISRPPPRTGPSYAHESHGDRPRPTQETNGTGSIPRGPVRPGLHRGFSDGLDYPLYYDTSRKRTRGFWIAVAVCCLVAALTPVSVIYLCWFFSRASVRAKGVVWLWDWRAAIVEPWSEWALRLGCGYAMVEVVFFLHQIYLVALIQTPSPKSSLTPEDCRKLFLRVLQSGLGARQAEWLAESAGLIPLSEETLSSSLQHPEAMKDLDKRLKGAAENQDVEKVDDEVLQGLRQRRQGQSKRFPNRNGFLRTALTEDHGVPSPKVRLTRLAHDDVRAIEFRERLRNWFGRAPWRTVTRQDALAWLSWSCFGLPLASETYPQVPTSRQMTWSIRLETLMRMAPTLSFLVQLVLIAYGEWQDRTCDLKYTDIDYRVFSDAVHLLWTPSRGLAEGWLTRYLGIPLGDPYGRATFRYTPLLAVLLSPIHFLPAPIGPVFGKVVFAALSSFAVPALLTSTALGVGKRPTHLLWTLNPMILNINTRGSSEVVLATLVLSTLVLVKSNNLIAGGLLWATSVHWKIYPIIFAPSIWRLLSIRETSLISPGMWRFGISSAVSFAVLTAVCFCFWGEPFIRHTYLYHVDRLDHRHNFSSYFYPIYHTMFTSSPSLVNHPATAFLPQFAAVTLAGLRLVSGTSLEFTWFVQTYLFVLFNKVITSQYFIWYLFLFPPVVARLGFSWTKTSIMIGVWVASQAGWLATAYQLELRAKDVYVYLWIASIIFLVSNTWIISELIKSYNETNTPPPAINRGKIPISGAAGPSGPEVLELAYNLLEARTGTEFPDQAIEDGEYSEHLRQRAAEKAKVMRLTLDPVNALPRPFGLYAFALSVNWLLRKIIYRKLGFKLYKEGNMEYLLRMPKSWAPGTAGDPSRPIVYIHGLGFGLLQNHLVVMALASSLANHPIMIPLQPHIGMHVGHPHHLNPMSRQDTVRNIMAICDRWGFHRCHRDSAGACCDEAGIILLSHSNGSIAHGWLLKDKPCLITRQAFVDPVIFCLWEGDVCYNFCYRKPRTALEVLLHYFIASEVGIANTIQRHFDWSANALFYDQIPFANDASRTVYLMGGEDIIIDAYRVKAYLENHGASDSIIFDDEKGHGDGLDGPALKQLVAWLSTGTIKR